MRKKSVLLLLLFLPLALYAADWEAGAYIGYRESTTTFNPVTLEIFGSYEGAFLSVRTQNDDYTERFDFNIGYDLRTQKAAHIFTLHTAWMTEEGGWTDLCYLYTRGLRVGVFSLDLLLGIGGAFSWSVYGPDLTWGISPVVGLDTGLHFKYADIILYAALFHPEERDFHYTPVAGGRVEVKLGDMRLIFEGYAKAAEYIIDPWLTLNAYAFRLGCSYRGSL